MRLVLAFATGSASAVDLLARPLALSAVELRGDWAEAQRRDQEVLMSLNMSRFACHFTTTANLTSCSSLDAIWQTYEKTGDGDYEHKLGFLAAGHDVQEPRVMAFQQCLDGCSSAQSCKGVTFQHEEQEAREGDVKCYMKSDLAFTPQTYKGNCVAPGGNAEPLCAPLPGEQGFGGYYGHYQGHWLSATAFLINSTQNATVKQRADDAIETFAQVMEAWKQKYGYDGYLFPYDPLVFDKLLAGHGAGPYYSVPFYTLHKLMAGLLDQYTHAGSEQALTLVTKMADWTHRVVEETVTSGGEDLWQKVLLCEWGGMNDVLYALYELTGKDEYYTTARRFNGWVFSASLAEGHDNLAELPFPHANFHLPEIVGFARAYELTGNSTDAAIARNFFEALSANHSFCTGGSNTGECWQQPRDLGAFLTEQTQESCTQYNVLKVARHLFTWSADPSLADFYERAILNGMIGNQNREDPDTTSYIYMIPLGEGHGPVGGVVTKPWGKSDWGFPCCWGTLSESFAKLGDSVYFAAAEDATVFVNQFVSSRVNLDALGLTLEQESSFLTSPNVTTTLTVRTSFERTATIKIRVPAWLEEKGIVSLNGAVLSDPVVPGSFFALSRQWKDGDIVEVSFPPSLWTEPLNDYHAVYNATVAFKYGPLVLAGVDITSDIFVPKGDAMKPSAFISRTSATELLFEAVASDGSRMSLVPLRDVLEQRYAVYFHTAGTKPAQPEQGYCPQSQGQERSADATGDMDDSVLVSAGAPAPPPVARGHGVAWQLSGGRYVSLV